MELEHPFDACWDRLDRADQHRTHLAAIWNEYIDGDPFDISVTHHGDGVHILRVIQDEPIPSAFSIELGEWLYNLRTCLDYIVWATCAHATESMPPPDETLLQYPIYDSEQAWNNNLRRLRHLLPHHVDMLERMQPFRSNKEANYLGVINNLARIDRHRRLTIGTAYLAEVAPVIEVPDGCVATLQWGQRVMVGGEAEVARISVSPWNDGDILRVNPRAGIDPEVAEWSEYSFWRRMPFDSRLTLIQAFVAAEVAVYECDCLGHSRKQNLLTDEFKTASDQRDRPGPILVATRPAVEWGPPLAADGSGTQRLDDNSES